MNKTKIQEIEAAINHFTVICHQSLSNECAICVSIKTLLRELQSYQWRSVGDLERVTADKSDILILLHNGSTNVAGPFYLTDIGNRSGVSHWMPVPPLPAPPRADWEVAFEKHYSFAPTGDAGQAFRLGFEAAKETLKEGK